MESGAGARSRLIMHRGVPFSLNIAWRISYDAVMGKYCYWIIMEWRVGKLGARTLLILTQINSGRVGSQQEGRNFVKSITL